MKIAVSATDNSLEATVDPRFGRCPYFIIVDTNNLEYEGIDNTNAPAGGAGIAAARLVANKGVKAVLTGNCGPNAYQVLSPAGIQVITGVNGTVISAVNNYNQGIYTPADSPSVADHFGR